MATWQVSDNIEQETVKSYEEFVPGHFEFQSLKRPVFKSGTGPAIIIIHEVPGIYDKVFDFARRLNDAGFTCYMPSLVGKPGKPMSNAYALSSLAKVCVSKEFTSFAKGKEAPIADWLRALARCAHEECGGPGVGAVGMCFSGGFALAMMADESVIAPVLSQPSMPMPLTKAHKASIDTNTQDLSRIKTRLEENDSCLLGLRFTGDIAVPSERFKFLKETFGERFEAVDIDSSSGNPFGINRIAHSVLTKDYVDEPEHPTYKAMEKVLALFNKQLFPEDA